MRNTTAFSLLLGLTLIFISACSNEGIATTNKADDPKLEQEGRWYTQQQVSRGNTLYQANCAICHKPDAAGTADWKKLDANNKLPPPPLNGNAHTWHHPLSVLRRTVRQGGIPLGGTMPGFASNLNAQQIDDILAWVQSHWSEKIYRTWNERNSLANKRAKKS